MIKLESEIGLEDVQIGTGIECWTEPIDRYHLRSDQHCVVGVRMMDGIFDDVASVIVWCRLKGRYLQSRILLIKISIVAG